MNSEQMKSYTNRITNASKSELVVIVYEIIITDLKDAILSLEYGKRDHFENYLRNSKRLLKELMDTLDYKYKISFELSRLYLMVDKFIADALYQRNKVKIDSAIEVMEILLLGFEGVAAQDKSGPVMMNSEHIYAGLTYGKGSLNEISLGGTNLSNIKSNRGYMA